MSVRDKYPNFATLACGEPRDAWHIAHVDRRDSMGLIIAPHGGGIEPGTSELAAMIAGEDYSLYCFEGLKLRGNRDLHITSHHFDEPTALSLAAQCTVVVGIHGCRGAGTIYVGGLDLPLVALLADVLIKAGLAAAVQGHAYPATDPDNICNRGSRRRGAQLEITRDLRSAEARPRIAGAVREAITTYVSMNVRGQ